MGKNSGKTATVFLGTISAYGEVVHRKNGFTTVRYGEHDRSTLTGRELIAFEKSEASA